jgi:hypothetical protein
MNGILGPARARLISLALLVIGAGLVWVHPSDQLRGGARALSLVVIAGVGALVAARATLRRLASIVVALCALGLIGGGTATAVIGGIVAVIGALVALLTVKSWPVLGARYDRAPAAKETDLWTALDRGEDPTAR